MTTAFPGQCLDMSESDRSSCHRCTADRSACERCGKAHYLHGGVCVACCPDPTCPLGRGNYGRVCAVSSRRQDRCYGNCPSAPSNCDIDQHCHVCQPEFACRHSGGLDDVTDDGVRRYNASIAWLIDQSGSVPVDVLDTTWRNMHRVVGALFADSQSQAFIGELLPECVGNETQIHLGVEQRVGSFDGYQYLHAPAAAAQYPYVRTMQEYVSTPWVTSVANPLTLNHLDVPFGTATFTNAALVQLANALNIASSGVNMTSSALGTEQPPSVGAKLVVLVTDGITIEACGQPSITGSDNCVVATAQRFHRAGYEVHVVVVVARNAVPMDEPIFQHFKELTSPADSGRWDAAAGAYLPARDARQRTLHTVGSLADFGDAVRDRLRTVIANRADAVTEVTPGLNGEPAQCARCARGRYLLEGRCIDACPSLPLAQHECRGANCVSSTPPRFREYVGRGRGNYGRSCVQNRDGCGIADCHSCVKPDDPERYAAAALLDAIDRHTLTGSPICEICSRGTYLLHGRCVPNCPASYVPSGRGSYHRHCVSPCASARACQPDRCRVYNLRGEVEYSLLIQADHCTACAQGHAVLDGRCVRRCPGRATERAENDGSTTLVCAPQ